jgi:Fe-S-cluster containining protein
MASFTVGREPTTAQLCLQAWEYAPCRHDRCHLMTQEGSQMRITCRKCGKVQEADEKTAVCPDCRTILRRCVDCAQYEVRTAVCRVFNRLIPAEERHYPTFSSNSTYCRSYVPSNPPPA